MNALEFNNKISLFRGGMKSKTTEIVTMEDIFHLIAGSTLHDVTEKCHYFASAHLKKDLDREKQKAMCFTPSMICNAGHGTSNFISGTGRGMVDFDDLLIETIFPAMELLRKDPYVELAHTTISGTGIRIIYQTDITDIADHPYAYAQGNEYFARLLGFTTDARCKDYTRCSVMCEDPNVYFNPDAQVMHIEIPSKKEKEKTKIPKKVGRPRKIYSATVNQVESTVLDELARQGKEYTEGRYNEYVSSALYLMNDFGVSEEEACDWAVNRFNDYHSSEVTSICHSVYLHTGEHGKRSLPRSSSSSSGDKGSESHYASVEELEDYIDTQAKVRLNLFNHRREVHMLDEKEFRPLTDIDENTLWLRAKKVGLHTSNRIFTSILNSEYIDSYHPFRSYIESLPEWDGVTDYISQVADLVETNDPVYFRWIFKKWFVGVVGSILDPDIINHEILTFIGKEGIYKTTFFNLLLPSCLRMYFCAKISGSSPQKDDLLAISEFMLICLEEIDSMSAETMNQIKASVTLPTVNIRAPYAHNREYRAHNSSFCATGNNRYYLPEGDNRRWLSIYVLSINGPRLSSIPYEGLYAQAISLFHSHFRYWFDDEETQEVVAHNKLFKEPNIEEELLMDHYRIPRLGETPKLLSLAQIMLTINLGLKHPLSRVKLRQALDKLGFRHTRTNQIRGFLVMELTREEIEERQRLKASEWEEFQTEIQF